MILIDTDIMIDLLRGTPEAASWLDGLAEDEVIGLPGYVVLEVLQGCQDKADMLRHQKFLKPYQKVWPTAVDSDRAIASFATAKLSHNTGLVDVLIGECAIGLGEAIHTRNGKHFVGIPGITVKTPYVMA